MRQLKRNGILVGMTISAMALATALLISDRARAGHHEKEHIRWQPTLLVQLQVADLDRAIDFYTNTMGLKLELRNEALQWARIDPGIPGVTIGLGVGEHPGSGSASINLGVGRIEEARAILESRGVVFDGPTLNIPGVVQLADFKDPDGNRIRLAGHSSK